MVHAPFRKALLISLGLELASFVSYFLPWTRAPFLTVIAVAAIFLAWRDLKSLFALLTLEMVIGSHGHLLFIEADGRRLTIRMVLFGVLAAAWLIRPRASSVGNTPGRTFFPRSGIEGALAVFAAAVAWGVGRGLMTGNGLGAVVDDANAYAFILLVPIALDLVRDREIFARLTQVFAGALSWLALKSLLLAYLFSHAFGPFLTDVYRWQRTYWLTEITRLGDGGWHRVFAASDIFLLPGVMAAFMMFWKLRGRRILYWMIPVTAALWLSFSRSIMLGAVAGLAAAIPSLVRTGLVPLRRLGRFFLTGIGVDIASLCFLAAIAFFPIPTPAGFRGDAFADRLFGADAAATSRWNILPPLTQKIAGAPILGSGFGSVITYRSDDPRVISLHPGGILTTGAVEWQYLELWMKMGLFGLMAAFWLFWTVGREILRAVRESGEEDRHLAAALLIAFVAFVVWNVFTPYLNHPLGWMYLALLLAASRRCRDSR